MQTVVDIIERLGGTSAVAAALRLTPSTVSSWKTSGRVPRWRQSALVKVAKAKGLSLSEAQISAAAAAPTHAEQVAA